MAASTFSSTSTYSPGKGMSFAKDIGSRVLGAATSAKDEKKLQEKIEAEGGTVPESAKKGLFARALKNEFVTNPINDLKKSFNKKLSGAANVVGLFGAKGRALEDKMLGKKFSMGKGGFDRSGYQRAKKDDDDSGGGGAGGGGGSGGVASLGSLVLDVQAIASTVSSMQGLINAQMSISSQMSSSLEDIKNILSEQVTLQQQKISSDEMASREASLEAGKDGSETSKSTSTYDEDPLGALMRMFGDFKNIIEMIKKLPEMFGGLFKNIISKLPGGKSLLGKLGKGAAVAGAEGAAEAGGKSLLKGLLGTVLGKAFKAIPFGLGGLFDFFLNLAMGENPGKAAARAIGSTIGSSLGAVVAGILGLPSGPGAAVTAGLGMILGGTIGDWLGGAAYDMFAPKDNKMAAGGAMIGEAGAEAVVNLDSAQGRSALGGSPTGMDDAGQTYYSAIAGSTLAVTKEFIDGMGPIGSAVAPAIQDDISKLGKQFELPATSIKMSVGGAGLKPVPGAEKKGEQFLSDLVGGTLRKLSPEKKKDTESSTGSSSGSGSTTPPSSDETGGTTPADNGGTTPTAPPKPAETNSQYAQRQLKETVSGVNPTMVPAANTQGYTTIDQFNVANPNFERVKYDTGNVAEGYFYDSKGNIYQIKEDGTRRVISNDKTILKKGVPNGWMNERMNFFQRNLRDGRVTLSHKPTIGAYDYASNGVYTRKQRLSVWADESNPGAASNIETYAQITPVSKYDPTGTKFNVSQPYGPVPQTSMGRPNDPGKGKAESGIKALLTLSGGTWPNLPVHSFSETKPHHGGGDQSDGAGGFKRDYLLQKPNAKDGVLAGPSHKGAPVPAGMKGYAEVEGGSVNAVRIWDKPASDPTRKMRARFLHFDSIRVKTGDQVNPGTILGGQGNKPNYDAYHVHLEASAKDQDQWIKTVDAMIAGGQLPSDSENPSDPGVQTSDDPFEALEQGLQKMFGAIGGLVGEPKTKAEYEANVKTAEAEYKTKYMTATGNVATPAAGAPAKPATPIVIPTATGASASMRPTDTTQEQRLQRTTTPSSTAGLLAPA